MKESFSHLPSVSSWPMQHLLPRSRLFSPMSAVAQTLASYSLTIAKTNKQTKKLPLITFPKPDHQNECIFLGRTALCLYFPCHYKATLKCWLVCNPRLCSKLFVIFLRQSITAIRVWVCLRSANVDSNRELKYVSMKWSSNTGTGKLQVQSFKVIKYWNSQSSASGTLKASLYSLLPIRKIIWTNSLQTVPVHLRTLSHFICSQAPDQFF